jgi:peptide/nickel transport system permease protein
MLSYTLRRILMAIPVVGVVAVVIFSLLYFTPGDPALVLAGEQATPAEVEQVRASLGLDKPPYIRFGTWVGSILQGDLGTSIFTRQPVAMMIGQRLGPTLSLIVLTMLIAIGVGVPFGVAAAARPGRIADRLLTALTVVGFSIPAFVAGYALAYVFATKLHWLPVQGFRPLSDGFLPFLRSLLLPAISLSIIYTTLIASVTRTSMLEVLNQDYIRTAVAKGLGPTYILFRHALKNASIPVVTIIGGGIATLIGAAVIVENVFALPGVGRLTIDAISHRDYPVIQGVVLMSSTAYVVVNLLVDLAYTVLDPRIRY